MRRMRALEPPSVGTPPARLIRAAARLSVAVLLASVAVMSFAACAAAPPPSPTLRSDIVYLASDELEGRMTGSAGEAKAAAYIAARMQAIGLSPLADGTYRQPFEFDAGSKALPGSHLMIGDARVDAAPYGFSRADRITGPLCYLGYGVVANDRDDYAEVDVTGAIVVVDRSAPSDTAAAERRELAPYLGARHRAFLAERRGAAAIVFTDDYHGSRIDNPVSRGKRIGIGAANVAADKFMAAAGDPHALAPRRNGPHSSAACAGPTATLVTNLVGERGNGTNVIGILPANRATQSPSALVVGAHYDHLGRGEIGSLLAARDQQIHNGADDNASGTAAILALAERARDFENRTRPIVFVAFSGEEIGLVGSSEVVANLESITGGMKVDAMLNFDMVGRLDDALIVQGVGSGKQWSERLAAVRPRARFALRESESAYLPTDAMSFYLAEIPVLNFFTGAHEDYHKPEDDAALINYRGLAGVVDFTAGLLEDLAGGSAIDYVASTAKPAGRGPGLLQVYLGTIPDYSGKTDGLRLAGIRENSPAARGGLRTGDTIVRIDDVEIRDVYDYTYFLSGVAPGVQLNVQVLRGGNELSFVIVPDPR
jgi:hypothetical protein